MSLNVVLLWPLIELLRGPVDEGNDDGDVPGSEALHVLCDLAKDPGCSPTAASLGLQVFVKICTLSSFSNKVKMSATGTVSTEPKRWNIRPSQPVLIVRICIYILHIFLSLALKSGPSLAAPYTVKKGYRFSRP